MALASTALPPMEPAKLEYKRVCNCWKLEMDKFIFGYLAFMRFKINFYRNGYMSAVNARQLSVSREKLFE